MRTGYYVDYSGPQPIFRCERCKYDGMEEKNVIRHVAQRHTAKPRELFQAKPMTNWRVVLGLLTWNNRETSMDTAMALVREADALKLCGVYTQIAWVDNGSTDGTRTNIRNVLNDNSTPYRSGPFDSNMGQSVARNKLLTFAEEFNADWLLLVDGDIVMVPYSVAALLDYTIQHKTTKIGCIGLFSPNCSSNVADQDICQQAFKIGAEHVSKVPPIAWTQYGLFNMAAVCADNVRFDEADCFQGPGWGFEDDDFGLQLQYAGYESLNTHMRYFHLRRSGLRNLDQSLAAKVFEDRRRYVMGKWGSRATHLAGAHLPQL